MFKPKPKGGAALIIGFGKPKEGPPPLKRMDAEEEPPARKPMGMAGHESMQTDRQPERAPTEMDMRHEQGEQTMDFGAIGEKFGLDPDSAKAFAYDVLEACMKATGGAMHEQQEPQAAEEYNESDTENYPA